MIRRKSRLARKEEAKSIHRAIFYGGLTFLIALGLVFLGIPVLIRMAIFLGNLRSSSLSVETQDTLPPPPPRLSPILEATNSAQIKIEGFAEPGAVVKIFASDILEKETVANKNGTFSIGSFELTLGKNEIHALATDEAGNTSQKSNRLTVSYDRTPPELSILEPAKENRLIEEENKITVKGKTEKGATVYINDHIVIIDSEGNFQYPVTFGEGENEINVKATDQAGNRTEEKIIVNYSP